MKKLIAVLVSVNYGDILEKVIENNLSIVDDCIIITIPTDDQTINLAKKYNLTYFTSTSCYDNNAPFNKSKMINIGLKYIYETYPNDVYLIMDADIILNKNIRIHINNVKHNYLFGTNRYLVEDINSDLSNLRKFKLENPLKCYNCCVGYTQLFVDKKFYDEIYDTAAVCDMYFAKSFKYNIIMYNSNSIHLGIIQKNWLGRIV
jgi:hypothetical protein